jgi:tRNA A37 methylthiotransferase MiaB
VSAWVEELTAQRAAERIGEVVSVLVEEVDPAGGEVCGRAEQQGPDVDGTTTLLDAEGFRVGDIVEAQVTGTLGVDLLATVLDPRGAGSAGAAAIGGAR